MAKLEGLLRDRQKKFPLFLVILTSSMQNLFSKSKKNLNHKIYMNFTYSTSEGLSIFYLLSNKIIRLDSPFNKRF
jgi:hypothetical protein